jgi:hypothetical protein
VTEAPVKVVSLLSDYGLADGFVGALHSVLRSSLPGVPIVDLTHDITPRDVRAGSLALQRAAPYLAPGVVLAVVDPGVGTRRRNLAVEAGGADIVLVGPDNGLLLPAVDTLGGAGRAVELQDRGYWLPSKGPTFAGRDVLAPAAARLAAGADLSALGDELDPGCLVRLPELHQRCSGGTLEAEVTWVDRFGNVQLAATADDLAAVLASSGVGSPALARDGTPTARSQLVVVSIGAGGTAAPEPFAAGTSKARLARVVRTYADLAEGELGVLVDSHGRLALSLNGASAARSLSTCERDYISLSVHLPSSLRR